MYEERKIGNIIRLIRKRNHLTQEELARKIHIGRSTLSDYEREKTDINFYIISEICRQCGYRIEFKSINDTKEIITVGNIDRKI